MKKFKIGDRVRVINYGLKESQKKYLGKKAIVEQIHDEGDPNEEVLYVRFKNGAEVMMYSHKFNLIEPKKAKPVIYKPLDNYEKLHSAFYELLYVHAQQYEKNGTEEGSHHACVIKNWLTQAGLQ